MAKATVSTLQGKYSDVVLGKAVSTDHGYNYKEVEMTWAEKGLVLGLVVKADGTPLATKADAADAYGVLIDRKVLPGAEEPFGMEVGTKYPMVLGVRGLTLNFHKLVTLDGVVIDDAVAAALEAKGNLVTKHYFEPKFSGEK